MSDSAFSTAPYPSHTTAELRAGIEAERGNPVMVAEIARREAVAAGDWSRMTAGERLRAVRSQEVACRAAPRAEGCDMRKTTIYEAMRAKLGRPPTHREQCDEVRRIIREAREAADIGRAAHGR